MIGAVGALVIYIFSFYNTEHAELDAAVYLLSTHKGYLS